MKNDYEIRGDITVIFLNSPKYGPMETTISTDKLDRAKEFPNTFYASYNPSTKSFYASGNITISKNKRRVIGLHQWIMKIPVDKEIDHIDHETLNNTDGNLRVLLPNENKQNKKGARSDSKSGIRGVTWNKASKKWEAGIRVLGKNKYLGVYDDIEEARKAVVQARKEYMPFSVEA